MCNGTPFGPGQFRPSLEPGIAISEGQLLTHLATGAPASLREDSAFCSVVLVVPGYETITGTVDGSVAYDFLYKRRTLNPLVTSSKVITPSVKPKSQPKPNSSSQSQPSSQSQSNSRSRSGSSRPQSGSQSSSKSSSQSHTQSGSQSSSQSNSKSSSQKNNPRSSSGRNSGRGSNSGGGSSSDKQGKGSNDPIKMVNKYDILDDDMETT